MNAWAARVLAAMERFAAGPRALPFLFCFGAAEAAFFPIVADVPLLLFALLVPRRTLRTFAAFVLGALTGSLLLFVAATLDPVLIRSLVGALPGIDAADFATVRDLFARDGFGAFLQFGPGIPVKVDVSVAAELGWSPLTVAAGVVANRITRIVPTLLAAALAGAIAPRLVRRFPALLLTGYAGGWFVLYLIYWGLA